MMRPLASRTYVLGFLATGAILFTLLVATMLVRTAQVEATVLKEHQQAAARELRTAVETVLSEASRLATQLADWDQVHYQFSHPTYYVYWREQTLQKRGELPIHLQALELYDAHRAALLNTTDTPMPHRVPNTQSYFLLEENRPFLHLFVPVMDREAHPEPIGFIGLKIDFFQALFALNHFIHVDTGSVTLTDSSVKDTAQAPIPAAQFVRRLAFEPIALPGSESLKTVMVETLLQMSIMLIGMTVILYWIVTFLFARPLRQLERHIQALRSGRDSPLKAGYRPLLPVTEMETLRHSLNAYQEELDQVHDRLDEKNVELWAMAHKDSLTGVFNRRAFDLDWLALRNTAAERRLRVSFMLLDCDFFKAINDTYGHAAGDSVIQHIAHTVQGHLRKGDRLYRLGGDEFATFVLNSDPQEVEAIARRCVEAVERDSAIQLGIRESVKVSAGLAHWSGVDDGDLDALPRQADLAMYQAKRMTRNKIMHFTGEMDESALALLSNRIVDAVMRAIETGERLVMHYQPIVKSDTGEVEYFEALVRIEDEGGMLPPSEIFPVVARRGMEAALDFAVIERICKDLDEGRIPAGIGISINISASALAASEFCERISTLRPYMDQLKIVLEITETTLITHLQQASECLGQLRDMGFIIALDDFGSGYSSIRYLSSMPVDIVKFDITMTQDLARGERSRIIVAHTARLILEAGYRLVAEGIEDEATLERVREMGATHFQGYLFGRPKRLPTQQEADQASA